MRISLTVTIIAIAMLAVSSLTGKRQSRLGRLSAVAIAP
jgi:hypothetical protein